MSISAIAFPVEGALVVAQVFSGALRPMLGVGLFATFFVMFRPLLAGLLRAGLVILTPRKSLVERRTRDRFDGMGMLRRLARGAELSQPDLAAELRAIACRG